MKVLVQTLTAAMLLVFSVAYAGLAFERNVEIDLEGQIALGALGIARFSDNPDEYIGCGVRHTLVDGVFDSWAFCQAGLSPENNVSCITFNAELIDKIAALSNYDYVEFWWDNNGECTHFGFSTQSLHLPSGKDSKQ